MVDDDVSINYDYSFYEVGDDDVHVDEYFSAEEMSGAGLFCPVSNSCSHLQESCQR